MKNTNKQRAHEDKDTQYLRILERLRNELWNYCDVIPDNRVRQNNDMQYLKILERLRNELWDIKDMTLGNRFPVKC